MVKLITLLITVPLSLFVLLFAVSNTHEISVYLNLVGFETTVGLYTISLTLMALGFLSGCLLVWLNLYGYRIKYWRLSRKNTKLEDEVARLKSDLDTAQTALKQNPPVPMAIDAPDTGDTDPNKVAYYDR